MQQLFLDLVLRLFAVLSICWFIFVLFFSLFSLLLSSFLIIIVIVNYCYLYILDRTSILLLFNYILLLLFFLYTLITYNFFTQSFVIITIFNYYNMYLHIKTKN